MRRNSIPVRFAVSAAALVLTLGTPHESAALECGFATGSVLANPAREAGSARGALIASDALIALRASIEIVACELCVCDVDNSGEIFASDALTILRKVVDQPVEFDCPRCFPPGEGFPTGSASGFVFIESEGTRTTAPRSLVFGNSITPPIGFEAAGGATIKIEGDDSGNGFSADEFGAFFVDGIPTGPRALRFALNGSGLRVPLTVITGATVGLGDPPIDRAAALSILETEVLDGLEMTERDQAFGVCSQQPLPTGTVLATENPARREDFQRVELLADSWLCYIDFAVNMAFGHPTKHVLIDAGTGGVLELDRSYWPRPNDVPLWRTVEERLGDDVVLEPSVVAGPIRGLGSEPPPRRTVQAGATSVTVETTSNGGPLRAHDELFRRLAPRDHPECDLVGNRDVWAVFVKSSDNPAFEDARFTMLDAILPTLSITVEPGPEERFQGEYITAIDALNLMTAPCDIFIVYFAGNGGWDDSTAEGNQTFHWMRTDESLGEEQSDWIGPVDLALPLMDLTPCHLISILDFSFSQTVLSDYRDIVAQFNSPSLDEVYVIASDQDFAANIASPALAPELFLEGGSRLANGMAFLDLFLPRPVSLPGFHSDVIAQIGGDVVLSTTGADTLRIPPLADCAPPPCEYEDPPEPDNDDCLGGTDLPVSEEGFACGGGYLDVAVPRGFSTDQDHFTGTFPAGEYRLEVPVGTPTIHIDGITGGPFSQTAPLDFTLDSPTDLCIGFFGDPGSYAFEVIPVPPAVNCAGVVIENTSSSPYRARFTSTNLTINNGEAVTVAAGETFRTITPSPITGLDLITIDNYGEFSQGFAFDVNCGTEQVFEVQEFVLGFFQRPLVVPQRR